MRLCSNELLLVDGHAIASYRIAVPLNLLAMRQHIVNGYAPLLLLLLSGHNHPQTTDLNCTLESAQIFANFF